MDSSLYSDSSDVVPVMHNCDITYIDLNSESHCLSQEVTRQDTHNTSGSELHSRSDATHVPLPWKLLPGPAAEQGCGDQEEDVALLPSALRSALDGDLVESHVGRSTERGPRGSKGSRWWTEICASQLCPLSGFPVSMLPYPPFKFRMDPKRAVPHRLVDGKYLALLVISKGEVDVCGRVLVSTDVESLDAYVHRCKLGPFRLGKALSLARVMACEGALGRPEAARELSKLCKAARCELFRLQKIQKNRVLKMQQTSNLEPGLIECVQGFF